MSITRTIAAGLAAALLTAGPGVLAEEPDTTKADAAANAPRLTVHATSVDDLKSVYATVRSKDVSQARVRTPGTIVSLKVDEGSAVTPGQVIALVADPKIALTIKALEARIKAAQSRLNTAEAELERSLALKAKGVAPQSRVDQAQTAFDTATNELKAARTELSVTETQIAEGEVIAPAAGRVLKVPVTQGSVVMAGETVATIAANEFLLRLELPERQARTIKAGDKVRTGSRSLEGQADGTTEGQITQVYPELSNGRVVADAEVEGLGTYYVGERVTVWISAGKRTTIVIPPWYVFKRYGLDFVRLAAEGGTTSETVVQTGRRFKDADGTDQIEILGGLKDGDTVVAP